MREKLSDRIIEKLNGCDGITDSEVVYMWCLFKQLEEACRRLPSLEIISKHAVLEQTRYSGFFYARKGKFIDDIFNTSNKREKVIVEMETEQDG